MSSILVIGPSWVGDMVMAQSLFHLLKQQAPDILIDVLAPPWSLPLLERMPEIHQGIGLPCKHAELGLGKRWRVAQTLRQNQYSKAIILPRSFKSALVPLWAGIPERIGYSSELRSMLLTNSQKRPPTRRGKQIIDTTVKRYLRLGVSSEMYSLHQLDAPPSPQLSIDDKNAAHLLQQLQLNTERPIVGLCPGAEYGPAKQWPLEYHRQLARQLVADGNQVWIFGSDKDRVTGDTIQQGENEHIHNLCGKTSLTDVVDLIAKASVVISHDSGLMHIAAAVGTAVVAIYGSSSPEFTPPLTDRKTIVQKEMACSPCFERTCRFGHYKCLREITVNNVLAAAAAYLEKVQLNQQIKLTQTN